MSPLVQPVKYALRYPAGINWSSMHVYIPQTDVDSYTQAYVRQYKPAHAYAYMLLHVHKTISHTYRVCSGVLVLPK